ncbi:MAG: hypothetical protein IJ122_02400 [Methanobrevibacter sp.]|nr:hypothetical protein [Methanobrevibacter sp.]
MFEELFGNCPQSKLMHFLITAPVDEFTKQQLAVGSGISRVTLDKFINTFIENEVLLFQNSRYILNTKSEFVRKLFVAQDEFIKFHFNKQLEEGVEEIEELSDEKLDAILDKIPDELDFDELKKEVEFNEEILVNKKEYENLKDYFLSFSNKEMTLSDFSAIDDKKWYTMDVIE